MSTLISRLIPKHPVPMKTVFRHCFLVNWAIDPEVMRRLLPEPIEPDIRGGSAYLSIVIAEMERMRPAFLPAAFGITYNQVVYRAVVRCGGERGVYFVRSDADHPLMCLAGNWLTFFQFHLSRIRFQRTKPQATFDLDAGPAGSADIHALYDLTSARRTLPPTSSFASLDEEQQFLVELYQAFGVHPATGRVVRVRIKRGSWDIRMVDDLRAEYAFMQREAFTPQTARLDSIFYVRDLPYYWYTLESGPEETEAGSAPKRPMRPSISSERRHLALACGAASTMVTAAVMAAGRAENGSVWPAINAVAHALYGERALKAGRFEPSVSLPAMALNATAVSGWIALYRLLLGRSRWPRSLTSGVAGALLAYWVDYHVVPKRLTPGFEARLGPRSVALIYGVLGLCFALWGPAPRKEPGSPEG